MDSKLVSIITPCYNSERFIAETIQSVQKQTYPNWEMLITDDGSTDNSVEIIKTFIKNDGRIKLFEIKNAGPGVARNNSIKHVKGNYMAFIDSDDLWFPEFLSTSLKTIGATEGFVFSSYKRCDEITLKPVHEDFIVPDKVNYHDILKTNSISCLTAFIDIEKLGKKRMPEVRYRQDMGLWLRYLKEIDYAEGIKIPLAIYRIRNNSHSRNKWELLKPQWYFYRHVEHQSFMKAVYYMAIWAYYGYRKYR